MPKISFGKASYSPKLGEKYDNRIFKSRVDIQIIDLNHGLTKYLNIWLFDRALVRTDWVSPKVPKAQRRGGGSKSQHKILRMSHMDGPLDGCDTSAEWSRRHRVRVLSKLQEDGSEMRGRQTRWVHPPSLIKTRWYSSNGPAAKLLRWSVVGLYILLGH